MEPHHLKNPATEESQALLPQPAPTNPDQLDQTTNQAEHHPQQLQPLDHQAMEPLVLELQDMALTDLDLELVQDLEPDQDQTLDLD